MHSLFLGPNVHAVVVMPGSDSASSAAFSCSVDTAPAKIVEYAQCVVVDDSDPTWVSSVTTLNVEYVISLP